MSEQTIVRVTQRHIALGVVRDPGNCPIALAVLDALGNPAGALVDAEMNEIEAVLPGELRHADTPPEAQDFIETFDFLGNVGPIEFTLTWHVMETGPLP